MFVEKRKRARGDGVWAHSGARVAVDNFGYDGYLREEEEPMFDWHVAVGGDPWTAHECGTCYPTGVAGFQPCEPENGHG
jgi:hypothetical protein